MHGSLRLLPLSLLAGAIAASAWLPAPEALGMADEPKKPAVDCRLAKNKNKPECRQKGALSDEELYYAGYWLARAGRFSEALRYLEQARNKNDPRILNYIGYSTRKLGNVERAIGFYRKALAIDPGYTVARAYLGEAFLQQRELASAKGELAEIERRCGTGCPEYVELKSRIEEFEAADAGRSG